ncbi:hypothetical protein GALMADRAFT_140808 [Galerina marginata CBS 339.88]|uniref:Hemerythrin-like domain-containing protein n=1 Tax=Galerina marginata (strain CBS 339.88) TaxID=685588 RepID=A0A067T8F1_GALM3|nr:hypothetical protein GALMADRAFT_140808 [Galerina marginata CBS 339.88]
MFPLPLLSSVPDNLEKMKARRALLYQNTFMKNALIRALNVVYDVAPKIKASHPAFRQFMDYVDIVCDMISLHVRGDEVFFKSISQQCAAFRLTTNNNAAVLQNHMSSLQHQIDDWKKKVARFTEEALPQSISDDRLNELIKENIIWLGTNGNVSVLLPFCVSHHDPKTSKHWPPVTHDALQAIPGLLEAHPQLWKFAPFDAITRSSKTILL